MSGWKLFVHSLRMVTRNGRHALRISLPLITGYVLLFVMMGDGSQVETVFEGEEQISLLQVAAVIITLTTSLWTVVAWHRFVLVEEYPNVFPIFHGSHIAAYFFKSLLIGIVTALLLGVGLGLAGLFVGAVPAVLVPVAIMLVIAGVWFFYRLSPVLPAAALGQSMTLRAAWDATLPLSMSLLIAAGLLSALGICMGFAANLLVLMLPALGLAANLAINVLFTLFGASLLTTVYGVAIENRTL